MADEILWLSVPSPDAEGRAVFSPYARPAGPVCEEIRIVMQEFREKQAELLRMRRYRDLLRPGWQKYQSVLPERVAEVNALYNMLWGPGALFTENQVVLLENGEVRPLTYGLVAEVLGDA